MMSVRRSRGKSRGPGSGGESVVRMPEQRVLPLKEDGSGASPLGFKSRDTTRLVTHASLPDHFQRSAEQPIEVSRQRLIFYDCLFNRLLRSRPLIAEVHERRQHVVHCRALD